MTIITTSIIIKIVVLLACVVFLINAKSYIVENIASQDVRKVNRKFVSTDIESFADCAMKCPDYNCTSFSYGEKLNASECYPYTSNQYNGRQARTSSGEICQRWDSEYPHRHLYVNLPASTLTDIANYCRDMGGELGPWCYTMNPDIRWEYCSVDKCGFEFQHNRCYHDSLTAKDYTGTWSRTRTGKVCQRWDAQSPHNHSYTSASGFPDSSISAAENYCRDPGDSGYTWCYTTEPGTRWEACDVTSCTKYINDKKCYETEHYWQYTGQWDMTVENIICQRWDSQTPHAHSIDLSMLPDDTFEDAGNYCRDPDGEDKLWCFTTNPSIPWQFCGLEHCPPDHVTCYDGPSVRSYMGTWNKTKSGKACQRWDSQQPHPHSLTSDMFEEDSLTDAENFCRDPTGSGQLWCYTTDPKVPKEDCGIGNCNGDKTCQIYRDETLYEGPDVTMNCRKASYKLTDL